MLILGNKELLDGKLAVILNSSQSKTPCGNDSWIINTRRAVSELTSSGHTIITSIGMITWELALFLVSAADGKQVVISPVNDGEDANKIFCNTIENFKLDPSKFAMVFMKTDRIGRSAKSNWLGRDKAILNLAQCIFPISIRPRGRLQGLLESISDPGKIDNIFKVEYQRSKVNIPKYDIGQAIANFPGWDYITHWTRSHHGPWPGETPQHFYQTLIESNNEYPHSAFKTLLNIANEKLIRASSLKIRGRLPVIGFSETSPTDVLKILRWCPRQVNWNFEPYGIAIKKNLAEKLAIRPAIYGTRETYRQLSEFDKPYFQNKGGLAVDWSREREWRHIGDMSLENFKDNDFAYVTWNQSEAMHVQFITKKQAFSLVRNN